MVNPRDLDCKAEEDEGVATCYSAKALEQPEGDGENDNIHCQMWIVHTANEHEQEAPNCRA